MSSSRLMARENSWISAQWMTKLPSGSDVKNTETIATSAPLPVKTGRFGRIGEGGYLLSSFKFFSSATDCNVAFLLAKKVMMTGYRSLLRLQDELYLTQTASGRM